MSFPVLKEAGEFFTDFLGGSQAVASEPFVQSGQTGTGAQASVASVYPSNIGITQLTAGATSTGAVSLSLDANSFLLGAAPHRFRIVFQEPQLSASGTNSWVLLFGFANNVATASVTNGVWFTTDVSNSLFVNYMDNSVGVTAINVTAGIAGGALVAGTWYEAIIDINVPTINSNQAASPNLGGPVTGARLYFGPLVPAPQTNQAGFNSQARLVATIPAAKLPGYADTQVTGVVAGITGVTSGSGRNFNIDKLYTSVARLGYQ